MFKKLTFKRCRDLILGVVLLALGIAYTVMAQNIKQGNKLVQRNVGTYAHARIVPTLLGVIGLFALVARFSPKELAPFFVSAFEKKLQLNTYLVLVLREYIAATGLLGELPAMLSALPLPPALVFALMFFVGGTISGSAGIIALGAPLAFSAMGASAPLMALLMCACHSASLVAPVHICLVVASEYFKVPLGRLIFRTLPLSLIFCALMVGYYALLTNVI